MLDTRTSTRATDLVATPPAPRNGGLPFTVCALLYLAAAAAVASLNFSTPFPRGWWLVAYLSLVGGIAQLLLGPGLLAIARRASTAAATRTRRSGYAPLVLWNVGTFVVAATNMTRIPAGVPLGSLLLLAALVLFANAQRTLQHAASGARLPWDGGYTTLRWLLALSVLVGNVLAFRGYR